MNPKSTFKSVINNYLTRTYEHNGITLIALVITVIILLILAGVAIGLITGQNDLITKVNNAKDVYSVESREEAEKYNGLMGMVDEYFDDETEEIEEDYVLSGLLKTGDFVDYDAGTWTQDEINQLTAQNLYGAAGVGYWGAEYAYKFFAIQAGQSRNNSVTPNFYANTYASGWRVFSINNETGEIKIISAGTPEVYYHPTGLDDNCDTTSERILSGTYSLIRYKGSTALAPDLTRNIRNWSMYVNSNLAKEAHVMNIDECINATKEERATGAYYWIPRSWNDSLSLVVVLNDGTSPALDYDGDFLGIRVVITLKKGVDVAEDNSGDGTSPNSPIKIQYYR